MKCISIVDNFKIAGKFFAVKFFNANQLINVDFSLTRKCNLNCEYCGQWEVMEDKDKNLPQEMSIDQIKAAFYNLSQLKPVRINISGGEPLIRDDIPEILKIAFKKRFWISLTTNGILIKERIKSLKGLNLLIISIDGEETTNDYYRGKGTLIEALKGLDLCKKNSIPFMISSVISSKTTFNDIDFILRLCQSYDIYCIFHPVNDRVIMSGHWHINPRIARLKAEIADFKEKMNYLKKHPNIKYSIGQKFWVKQMLEFSEKQNSVSKQKNACLAGRMFFSVQPDGNVRACSLLEDDLFGFKIYDPKFIENYKSRRNSINCTGCFCYSYHMINRLAKLDVSVIWPYLTM